MAINSTSFTNTPQAGDDSYSLTEDDLLAGSTYDNVTNILALDVMSNDLGGNAKRLFSIDDGNGTPLDPDTQLLVKDVVNGVSGWETTDSGNSIRINNGKIELDLSHSLTAGGRESSGDINSLAAGEVIDDHFVYAIQLGNGTLSQAHVHVYIEGQNDAPVVSGTVTGTAIEDGAASKLDALADSSDVDHNTTLSVVDLPSELPAGVTYDATTHSFTLDPGNTAFQHLAQGATTTVSVDFAVSDGTASTPESVSWTVTGTNDAPAVTGAVTGTATEDGPSSTLNALANASDVDDGASLSVSGVPVSLPAGVSYDAATHSFTLDPSNSSFQHLAAGATTTVSVSYNVSDGITTTPASVSWTVTGTNDVPVVTAAVAGSATEDGSTSTLNALANASDVDDGTTLSVSGVPVLLPAGVSYDSTTHSFTLDPSKSSFQHLAAGATTTVSVSYNVSDGTATTPASVSWTVTGTNDAPIVTAAVAGTAAEDGSTSSLDALANASDVDDGASLSVTGVPVSLPAGVSYDSTTHSFTLDPTDSAFQHLATGATTVVSVDYDVSDGIATTPASVSWTVTGTNDAPVVTAAVTGTATEDSSGSTLNALANASDVDDGTTLSVTGVPGSLPAGVSYDAATHSFALDPANSAFQHLAAGASTTVSVSYDVSDGITTTPASVSWTVTGTNDTPVVTAAVTGTAMEDGSTSSLNALANASDVDDGATLSVTGVPASLPAGVSYDAATHSFTLDPTNAAYQSLAAGDTSTVSASYNVSDGTATTPASVSWTVTGVNDAASISGTATGSVTEAGSGNGAGTPTAAGMLAVSDADHDQSLMQAVSSPTASANGYGMFTVNSSGQWTHTLDNSNATVDALNNGQTLSDSFTVTSLDGSAQQVVAITINGATDVVNHAPVATDDAWIISQSTDAVMPIAALVGNDTDADGNPLSVVSFSSDGIHWTGLTGTTSNGTPIGVSASGVSLNENNHTGTDTFWYQISDGQGGTATGHVNIAIQTILNGNGSDTVDISGQTYNYSYINTGAGTDTSTGGTSVDYLIGGSGNDTLIGKGGDDILTGGQGSDTFRYLSASDKSDTIRDFQVSAGTNNDVLDVHDMLSTFSGVNAAHSNAFSGGYLQLVSSGTDTVVQIDSDGGANSWSTLVTLTNATLHQGDTSNFAL